jgi:hypothetical protein
MAAVTIRELLTKLGVDADTEQVLKFDAALGIAKKSAEFATFAVRQLTDATFGLVVATAQQGDEAAKAGARTATTAEEYQELSFAAGRAGASTEQLEVALKTLARTSVEAARGAGEAKDTYARMKIAVKDANGQIKPQVQLLGEVADGFKVFKTDAERAEAAQRIFGEGGTALLPLLKQGALGINALRQEARDLGFVLDNEASAASEQFTDRMTDVRLVLVGLRNQIGKQLLPVFTQLLGGFRDFVLINRQIIRARIDRGMQRIIAVVEALRRAFVRINRVVEDELGGWDAIFQQIEKAAKLSGAITALTLLGAAAKAANLALLGLAANPVGATVAIALVAVIALGLAIDDLIVFLQGGNSAMGEFLDTFGRADAVRAAIFGLVEAFGGLVEATRILDLLNAGLALFGLTLEDLKPLLLDALDRFFLQKILAIEDTIMSLTTVTKALTTAIDAGAAIWLRRFEAVRRVATAIANALGLARDAASSLTGSGAFQALNAARSAVFRASGAALSPGRTAVGAFGRSAFGQQALASQAPGLAAAGGGAVVNQEGDVFNISGLGITASDVEGILERRRASRNRQAIAATEGGER